MVAMSRVLTLRTIVKSIPKSLRHSRLAIRTGLGSSVGVNFFKVHPALPANPLQQTQECSKRCVNAFLPEHPSVQSNGVEIFRRGNEPFQSQINTNSTTMNRYVGNSDIRLDGYNDIPLSPPTSGQHPHLLNSEAVRDGAMQRNGDNTNFWQFKAQGFRRKAKSTVAAATKAGIIINSPTPALLQPTKEARCAEARSLLCIRTW